MTNRVEEVAAVLVDALAESGIDASAAQRTIGAALRQLEALRRGQGGKNPIVVDDWSNPESERRYREEWPDEPECRALSVQSQCGACTYFASFDTDWGLCCHAGSRHHLETVFEHFTCPSNVREGWGPHSFSEDPEYHCRCQGTPLWVELADLANTLGDDPASEALRAHLSAVEAYLLSDE